MNKNIKAFIYVSVFIHLSGGAALYMYYFNPSAPQPLMEDQVEELKANPTSQKITANHTPPVKKVSMKKPKIVNRKTPPVTASSARKKPTTPGPVKKKSLSPQGTDFKGESGKDFVHSTGPEKRAQKQPRKETPSIHPKTHLPVQKGKNKKADSLPVSTKAEGTLQTAAGKSPVSSNEETVTKGGEQEKQKSSSPALQPKASVFKVEWKWQSGSSPALQPKASVGKTPQPPETQEKTAAENVVSATPRPDTKDNKEDSASETNSPESLTEKTPGGNKDQKISETPSAPPQTESPEAEKKEGTSDSSPVSKSSHSSPKFRKFTDLKQKLGNPRLDYPQTAREQKMQGQVSLIYFIDPEGLVDQIQLEKSSGHSLLDNFVLRTIARYEFLPHQEGWIKHTVNFVLKGEEEQTFKLRDKNQ